jgi:LysR family transcriptional regulator (chromosome initiation inhibitor)
MNIDNAQLAAFAMVLREGSFEAAARRLHLTPSAISQRIKQLEEGLGQVLLQRTIPCQATAAGRTLARFSEQLALLEAEMLGELGATARPWLAPVRMPIVVNADSLDSWFLGVFDNPSLREKISFDVRVEDQDHSAALLREGSVMAAVSGSPAPVQGCTVEPLGVVRYRAVASAGHVARYFSAGIDQQSLTHAPMLTFNRKDGLQQRFIALFTDQAVAAQTHFIPSTHGFVDVARRGLGWGMMPEHFVNAALASGELVEISPGRALDVPLYWHRWRLNSPALNALSEAVHLAAGKSLRSANARDDSTAGFQ